MIFIQTGIAKKSILSCAAVATLCVSIASTSYAGGFMEDAQASLRLRNLLYDKDNRNGHSSSGSRSTEWGQGIALSAQSGFTAGTVGFGLDLIAFYGLKLDSGGKAGDRESSRQPALLFPRESDGSSVDNFSWAYVNPKLRVSKTEVSYGAHLPRLPIVQATTGNIAPQLFEGTMITSRDIENVTLVAGLYEKSKGRASSDAISMSISASSASRNSFSSPFNQAVYGAPMPGAPKDSNHFWFAGAEYAMNPGVTLRYYYAQLNDFYQQHMLGALTKTPLGDGVLSGDFRYYDSSSQGKNGSFQGRLEGYLAGGYYGDGVTIGEVDNRLASVLFTYQYQGHSVGMGYQYTAGDSDFVWLNQGDGSIAPVTTDIQVNKFTRAGQRTTQLRYGYNFAAAGVPGLTFNWTYLQGRNAQTVDGPKSENVQIIALGYAFQNGFLKGLGLRADKGIFHSSVPGVRDATESRLITEYVIPLR